MKLLTHLGVLLILGGEVFSVHAYAQDATAPAAKRSRLTNDSSEASADRRKLLLSTGEDKAVDLEFDVASANGIKVGNPTVVATTLVKMGEKRQLVFQPLKAGDTTVIVRDDEGAIRIIFAVKVTGSNLLRIAGEVRELLRDIEGIEVRVVGQKIIVDGEVLIPADYGRMVTVVSDDVYKDTVLNLATLSPMAMQVLAKKIQEDINAFAQNVKTRVVNGVIFLEGTVDSTDQAKRAYKIAELYLPEAKPGNQIDKDPSAVKIEARALVQNFLIVNPPPAKKAEKLVRVTVHFVELSKDYNKVFGFKWQPGFTSDPQIAIGQTDATGTGATGASFTATLSSLLPKLQTAQTAGYARILKTGTVIVKSGMPAKLEDQVKFPVLVASGNNGQVSASEVPVGLSVNVTPQIVGQSDDISMQLDLKQVNLVGRAPATGAPTTASHTVNTQLYVKSNESAAVAGVIASDVGTDFNKDDPSTGSFSGETSALFSLLRSKGYRKRKSQFVIFVTPQIVENASDGTEDLKKNFRVKVD